MKKTHGFILILASITAAAIIFYATRLSDDDEIVARVTDALQQHPEIDASRLQVSVENGFITIRGVLPHERLRSIVIQAIEEVDGTERVVDEMSVQLNTDEPGADP